MKLCKGMVIAYDPTKCETISDQYNDEHFVVGVVHYYDKYAECYDIDIGYNNLMASITSDLITRDSVFIISKEL